MAETEQTLRERLADAMRTTQADMLDDGDGDAARFGDAALSVFREWLESEAVIQIATKALPAFDFESPELGFSEATKEATRKDIRNAWDRMMKALAANLGDSHD